MSSLLSFIVIELVAEQAFAIRHGDSRNGVDSVVVMDHNGHVHTPASGLIGALRTHLGDRGESVLGSAKAEAGDTLVPSPLRALGTETLDASGAPVAASSLRIVERTAIDRDRGAAKAQTLRSAQEVPAGTRIRLYCEFVGQIPSTLVTELASWSPFLGSSRTTGYGRATVQTVRWGTVDLATRAGLALVLGAGGPSLALRIATNSVDGQPAAANDPITFSATIVDALFIGGGEPGAATNEATFLRGADGHPVIEGSSIKGVLRNRVAFIASSIIAACEPDADRRAISERGDVVADSIFGSPSHRGIVAVETSSISDTSTTRRPHVGIDRFSGGATPGLLFTDVVLNAGSFSITVRPLGPMPREARSLLLAALRDISDGSVGLGGKTSRGYGTVRLDDPNGDLRSALPLDDTTISWVLEYSTASRGELTEEVAS